MKFGGGFISAVLMLILFAAMAYQAMDWPENARGFPLLIAAAGMVFSAWLVISQLIEIKSHAAQTKAEKERLPAGTGGMVVWLVLLFAVTIIFGFWVGGLIFMLAFLRLFGRENWKTTVGLTAALMALLFIALSVVMKIPIYGGLLKLTPF